MNSKQKVTSIKHAFFEVFVNTDTDKHVSQT